MLLTSSRFGWKHVGAAVIRLGMRPGRIFKENGTLNGEKCVYMAHC